MDASVRLESELVPGGSGLLVLDDLAQLRFIPAAGDAVVLDADVESYEVDSSGCVVAVVTGEPDVGTALIRLPR